MTASTIIAICALILTLYGLWATRRHNRLSVTPHLCGFSHKQMTDKGLCCTYEISNNGIGPARITKFVLFSDGKEVPKIQDDLFEYVDSVIKAHLQSRVDFTINHSFDFGRDVSMKAGETRRIAEVFFPSVKLAQRESILKALQGLDARIEYQSFYGQKFVLDTRTKSEDEMKI